MTAPLNEVVTVIVDGYALSGWQEVSVRRSMQDAAIAFSLKATHAAWSDAARVLRKAEEIELRTSPEGRTGDGGDLLCIGAVDSYEADIGEGANKTITLHGRSHARDIIDSPPVNHPTGRVENKTILGAAQDLGAEFPISWSADVPLDVIAKIQRRPHETLFATIERLARIEGLLLAGQPDGSIRITRAGTTRHAGALIEGVPPVDRLSIKLQPAAEASEIHVRGQRATGTGADNLRQQDVYRPQSARKRHRPGLHLVEGDRQANKLHTRGKWHHLRSFAGNLIAPRVSRWRDDDGVLWEPGRLMAVKVPSEQLDVDFVLSEVTFRQGLGNDAGTRAELVFVDPADLGGGDSGTYTDTTMDPQDQIGG